MTPERWRLLNDLFHEALALNEGERPSFIASVCGDDDVLGAELHRLLDSHHRASDFLNTASRSDDSSADDGSMLSSPVGRRVGAYRLVDEIGRGGMGAVFLGERADGQFEQRVAVKLIKRGMDTAQVLERFRIERQILASLDHPHIARLLDGGTTDDGLPYFVMEHIAGVPIDRYVAAHQLPVRQRLELFLHVCDAVSYAHQHLVIHRDIKPHNVLVTDGGTPKLLDFGIAKMLQDAGAEGTLTVSGHQLLTPEYASPEQVDGRPTTTQTDVYSLGVVLYELLTGRSPYRPRSWDSHHVCEAVRSTEVERPSSAVARRDSDERAHPVVAATEPASTTAGAMDDRLRAQLRGDLDAIVLTALRKETTRRYASVEQFASDIRRHLGGLPVQARADSVWYRTAKFARRNRVALAAAALVTLALLGGTIATAWQAREARAQATLARDAQARAERRFSEVRKLANALIFDYHDVIKDLPGATLVRARLVSDALAYLNTLAGESAGDPSLQRELAVAYRRVGDVQGGSTVFSLGDTKGALESYRRSLTIFEWLFEREPNHPGIRRDVGLLSNDIAHLVWETGDLSTANAHAQRARELLEPLLSSASADLDLRLGLTRAYDVIGQLSIESGRTNDALDMHRRQLQLLQAPESDPEAPRVRRAISVAYQHLGDGQSAAGDLQGALENYRLSRGVREALSRESPNNADYKRLVAAIYFWEGDVLAKLGRTREALTAYRLSLAGGEALIAADPAADNGDTSYALVQIGNMLRKLGDLPKALEHYRRAQVVRAAAVSTDPASLWKRAALVEIYVSMCAAEAAMGLAADAAVTCGEGAALIQKTTVAADNALIRTLFADSYSTLGDAYRTLAGKGAAGAQVAHRREARQMYRHSSALWTDMQRRGIIAQADAAKPAAVSKALAAIEAALGPPGD